MKIKIGDKEVEATSVPFAIAGEPFSEYHMDNGDIIRCKHVVLKIFHVANERAPNGDPIYSIQGQLIMTVEEKDSK